MAQRKKYTPEQIVSLLRQVEVAVASGKTTAQASQEALISEQTYHPLAQGVRRPAGGSGAAAEGTGAKERQAEATGGGSEPGQAGAERHRLGKRLSPEQRRSTPRTKTRSQGPRRCAVDHATEHGMSERRACQLANQPRGTQLHFKSNMRKISCVIPRLAPRN